MSLNNGQNGDLEGSINEFPVWLKGSLIWLELDQMTLFQRRMIRRNLENKQQTNTGYKVRFEGQTEDK